MAFVFEGELFVLDGKVMGIAGEIAGVIRPLASAWHLKKDYEGLASVVEFVMEHFEERIKMKTLA